MHNLGLLCLTASRAAAAIGLLPSAFKDIEPARTPLEAAATRGTTTATTFLGLGTPFEVAKTSEEDDGGDDGVCSSGAGAGDGGRPRVTEAGPLQPDDLMFPEVRHGLHEREQQVDNVIGCKGPRDLVGTGNGRQVQGLLSLGLRLAVAAPLLLLAAALRLLCRRRRYLRLVVAAEPCDGDAAGLTLAPLPYLAATPECGNWSLQPARRQSAGGDQRPSW